MTTPTTDRRSLIVESAIDLIAAQGLRALTHRALDTALELPAGSTSYYFRTKRALIEAIVDRIATRSRTDFAAAQADGSTPPPTGLEPRDIAHGMAVWLDRLLAQRRNHLITRHALIVDLLADPGLHEKLVGSLFSHHHAAGLFHALHADDPDTAAADLIAVIEGAIFDRFAGARTELAPGTPASVNQLARILTAQLSASS
ncbi:TetR family transcriptional regulator [Nocardia yamanashiensis]|uniref:TetR/AcrR family transcriptional regulator n=1 Tax=Nocardia yamanashiensis TaxID=209247 RepID=UPI001E44845C|nr:TetR family transcriptional regulator [Nocardia yamanashiensis]UGT40052.1 TetR family transcriptional regulator [Nocardia yamanashiensis]